MIYFLKSVEILNLNRPSTVNAMALLPAASNTYKTREAINAFFDPFYFVMLEVEIAFYTSQ